MDIHASPAGLDFSNTELAFQARSQEELKWLYRVYRLIDSPFLTRIGPPLLEVALKLRLPVEGIMRKTLFRIFCGGESLEDSRSATEYLAKYGVATILDYAVEGEKSEAGFDATHQQLLKTIQFGGKYPSVAFVACKMTGLGAMDLMRKQQAGASLNEKEGIALQRIERRIYSLAEAAAQAGMPLFIDAEESWIQGYIDRLAEHLMETFNRERPIVHTTVQLYRHDRLDYLRNLLEASRQKGYWLGIKLVRGAYLEKEHDRAEEKGYPSPMQANKAATDRDFDLALEVCVKQIDHVSLCAGTHNESSSYLLTRLMEERGIAPGDTRIWFSQLLGMSDHLSFNLAHAGYKVAKYLPYGPVKSVIPYLVRRAQENTAIAGQSSREVSLIKKEIARRKSRG